MADMDELVQRFRNRILDTDPLKNILTGQLEFTPGEIQGWITEAMYDINEAEPQTFFELSNFPKTGLLLQGALIFMLRARGLLHLRNQVSYSDAGFSVNLDDKSSNYAQWMMQELQIYSSDKKDFKRSRIPRFRGVCSPMNGRGGW